MTTIFKIWRALFASGLLAVALFTFNSAQAQTSEQDLAEQDRADLARVEILLNDIRTLHARFVQIAEGGGVQEGEFFLERPGRLRFQYAPPSPILIVGTGKTLIFYDAELGQVSRLPIDRTPLGFLSADQFSFGGSIKVDGIFREPGLLSIALRDEDRPGEGTLTIIFSDKPLALRQWQVRDAQGRLTTVALTDIQTNIALDPELFKFVDPDPFGRVTPP